VEHLQVIANVNRRLRNAVEAITNA